MKEYNTLAFGCPHLPFEHKDYLPFLVRIYKAFNCGRVICLGDLVDNHAINYHEHDPDGWSPEQEMEEADNHLQKFFEAFPIAWVCRGNHDRLVDRKGRTSGLPQRCFKSFRDRLNLPYTWKDDFKWIFDGVCYEHGEGYSGDLPHLKAALNNRMHTVIAHTHHAFGVEYSANEQDIVMGVSTGCGIDRKRYAFEYGRAFKKKPILGCVVISHCKRGVNATPFTMDMT